MPAFLRASSTVSLPTSIVLALACAAIGGFTGYALGHRGQLGAYEAVSIAEAGLVFNARLDTGATVSSINAREIEIVGGSTTPASSNAGKRVRFTLENGLGESSRVEATIEQVRGIKTSDCQELRYHVYLTVRHRGKSYRLLINLNDRSGSKDKLLLGRNWLRHGFSVDVTKT
ncbi:MAG: putative ATP-dependent zinc protease [Gammaproteobacteria bacterium]|jgi:hypothetical protein